MQRKYLLLAALILTGTIGFADPLNSRTAGECLRQVREFIYYDDSSEKSVESYFSLHIEVHNVTGRLFDTDQVIVKKSSNDMSMQICFKSEIVFRISIKKNLKKPHSFSDISNSTFCNIP